MSCFRIGVRIAIRGFGTRSRCDGCTLAFFRVFGACRLTTTTIRRSRPSRPAGLKERKERFRIFRLSFIYNILLYIHAFSIGVLHISALHLYYTLDLGLFSSFSLSMFTIGGATRNILENAAVGLGLCDTQYIVAQVHFVFSSKTMDAIFFFKSSTEIVFLVLIIYILLLSSCTHRHTLSLSLFLSFSLSLSLALSLSLSPSLFLPLSFNVHCNF